MIKLQFFAFALRWLASSIAMYFCILWFGQSSSTSIALSEHPWVFYLIAGLIFSVLNAILKPLVKLIALPLAILTLGLSTLIINTAIVVLTIHFLDGVEMDFWGACISSLILSFANGVINFLIG